MTFRTAIAIVAATGAGTAAQAETVALKCDVKSGYNSLLHFGPVYYRIGEGKWMQWSLGSEGWVLYPVPETNLCSYLNGEAAACSLSDEAFSTRSLNRIHSIHIDRRAGSIRAVSDFSSLGMQRFEALGSCDKSTDPPPPVVKPPKKF